MISKNASLLVELISLFVIIPIILALSIHPILKITPILIGVIYCIYISIKQQFISLKELFSLKFNKTWKLIIIQFLLFVVISTALMFFLNKENLFIVLRKNWIMWLSITFFYTTFSVYPQEFLYRTFFFNRYQTLFKNPAILIITNAILFSLAHILFNNLLVFTLTLVGGFLFALTYYKTKSLLLTSIEHALYGAWLFTLGIGNILGFPILN